MTYRNTNDWRGYPVEGWVADVPDARPASIDEMLKHRALVLDAVAPIDRRIDAALAMAKDAIGGQLLIHLAVENKIVYQLKEAIGSVIFTNPDRSVRTVATAYFQRPGSQPRLEGMTVAAITRRAGDAARGQIRYTTTCATCHRMQTTGGDVGPDLTEIHKKFDLAGLVDAIVNPGAAVAFGFGAELFVTRRNEPHIGFIQSDGATVSIRDGYGRTISVNRDDIATRTPLKPSLMPDPLALALTEQDIADIAAFLMVKKP
jgi:putative heme-binding domain-containing protein